MSVMVSARPIANRAPPEEFKRIYLDHVGGRFQKRDTLSRAYSRPCAHLRDRVLFSTSSCTRKNYSQRAYRFALSRKSFQFTASTTMMQRRWTSSREALLTAPAIMLTQHGKTVGFAFSHRSSVRRILRWPLRCGLRLNGTHRFDR
ncbi:uncharacterized protein LOC143422675 [Xylocopa sonorina]|uniref:uncharacterized protein LOC143422675 n=1 Tax=Xylocopa sonorina TaxID=1818115 RepID=UPI00403AB668